MDNPLGPLELSEHRRSVVIGDPRVDRGRANRLVTEMVLHKLEGDAGVEKMRGDGVPETVTGEMARQTSSLSIASEQLLDLALAERPPTPRKHWQFRSRLMLVSHYSDQRGRNGEQRPLCPSATLQAFDHNSPTRKIHVAPREERHLADAEAVVVDQREERSVTGIRDRAEESFDLRLREIARKSLER